MKIIIIADPQVDNPEKKAFERFKEICKEEFNGFSLEIENTDLIYKEVKR